MSLAHYLLQVNLYLIVFYGFYKLLLDKETYFILNRIYLVAAGVLSLCIPFIRLEWLTAHKTTQQVYASVNWDAVLEQATIVTENSSGFNWGNAFVLIYCAGILFFLARLVFNLLTVKNLISSVKSGSAFSFFSKKIIDKNLPEIDVINIHEEAHIRQWHTLDILFFEIVGIITWLNPVIYFYKKSIKNIHEFLADEQAAAFQGDKAEYAMLILSQSFGISPNSLTNGFFNQSLIKKRIFMLQKERSKKIVIMKYGFFIPLFAILIIFSSATVRKNEKLIAISDQIPLEKPLEMVQSIVVPEETILSDTTDQATIRSVTEKNEGNWSNFYQFMSKAIKYPTKAVENNVQGNTQIQFTLKNGKVTNLSKAIDLGYGCDEEVMKAILSFKDFKKSPNGNYVLKVGFRLQGNNSNIKNRKLSILPNYQKLSDITITAGANSLQIDNTDSNLESNDNVFDFVSIEKQPEFPGGISKFYNYLGKSIKYPKAAVENNVQGKVFLSFIVEKDGSLSDITITRGLGSGTDEEAIRVLSESPRWNPGIAKGRVVRVKYNINVNFNLSENLDKKSTVETPVKKTTLLFKSPPRNNELNGAFENFDGVIIVDGIKVIDNNILKTINSNEIESVSILKDQSAISLYGNKAKSGVILITTKAGIKSDLFRKPGVKELTIDKPSVYDKLSEKF